MIPLVPGQGTLTVVNWDWLNGPAVLLIGFIASVLGIGQVVLTLIRRVRIRRAGAPSVEHEPVRAFPAAEPTPTLVPDSAPTMVFVSSKVDASGAATIGTSLVTPFMPITRTPDALFSGSSSCDRGRTRLCPRCNA